MATANELLAGLSTGDDTTLVIDNYLRTINIPKGITNLGVESDDEVLRLNFKMPRYLDDTDLSTFPIRINYLNAQGEGDVYTVSDKIVGSNYISFSWLVGPTATAYKGDTKFNVCMKTLNSDGYVDREYNTTIATLPVLEGLEVDEQVVAEYSDILEQWRQELFGISGVHVGSEAPTDGSNVWICPDDIPDAALPNPYKLILTGAVEAEYDGSSPLVISIPEGGADPRYFSITADGVISLKLSYRGVGEESYPASIGDGTEANLPEKLVIPDAVDGIKVKALSPGMFCRNTRLNEVVLPNTISEIPDYCFAYATNLRAMHNTEHITGIGVRGVSTTRIKRAIFPGLTSIEERGLGFNGYLEVVDIGNAVATLPDKVFSHCSRLREVNGGLNVKAIGQRAFLYTRKLKDLPLLANVTSIGDYAFFGSRISTSLEAGGNISDKAFPTIDNVTDFWSGVPFSACQNRIVTKLSQEAPAWKDTPVVDGDDRTTYYKGCSVFAIMHIHSAITGKYYSSPEQFVGEIKNNDNLKKYYSSYDNWTGYFEKAAEMLSDMGYNTEVYTNDLDVNSYKALVDALRAGAYVYSQIGTTGGWGNNQFDEGHVVVVYGINELGEVCVLDSAITQEPYRETGFEPDADVYTYTMPYQNLVGASSNFVIVYPPNVEPNTEDTGDYIPTPATAEIGQTIVVKAVDDSGKPTEWEAADFPAGGSGDSYELINTINLTEEVSTITIDTDSNGNSFSLKKILVYAFTKGGTNNTDKSNYHAYPNTVNAGLIRSVVEQGIYAAGGAVSSIVEYEALGDSTFLFTYGANSSIKRSLGSHISSPDTIQSFNLYAATTDYTFGVGTNLKVYGVRA